MNRDELIEKIVRLRVFYDRNLLTDSMRGNVIILASVVDALLVDLITSERSIRRDAVDSLKRGKDAYNTFEKAISTALLLCIICESTTRGLHLLRELRNDLAHGVELLGDDREVTQRICRIAEVLQTEHNGEPKWNLHGIAIRLLHGIGYDYGESRGWSRDEILAEWESIRQRVVNETAYQANAADASGATDLWR